ncbi:MAG: winged helix-turn-helix domain-containing tetratricopeptide repeat protein [Rhodospirillales bacterium]|jgi:TolB-like protein|nr:winged helix-turn-helix domain-containing tetratricopeptide repeat protein [Rhodospirillales bacterium]MDP6646290.1 winged helix-turn-helix domain-containing tetratricopeptide repeat protein [Rhodospirillales bacterium]|tara:strand:- start:876 stop:2423 length:1548 start_codon:yes stop_codon:yes gene_type:complete
MVYRFGEYALHLESLELKKNGAPVELEPQVFSLLACLIENADRVVSKDELIEMVWDGRIVSDGTLNTRINSVRRAVGDDGKTQGVIKTFPRRGFRFVAKLDGGVAAPEAPPTLSALSDKPSIAVLPFDNLSGDPEQEYFSDGLADDVISALSRFRQLAVVARNSSFAYKGAATDVREVAKELGVGYVLEGSVRKSGERVRISVQLIDGSNGSHLWAERYDRDLEDIFTVQDEITEAVVGAVEPEPTKSEIARARAKKPENLTAWELYLQGTHYTHLRTTGDIGEAIRLLKQAIEADPNFAPAYQGLSYAYCLSILIGNFEASEENAAKAISLAETALRLDRDDDRSHMALGRAHQFFGEMKKAYSAIEEALQLNSTSAFNHYMAGRILVRLGRAGEGLKHAEEALRLSPRDMWISPFMVTMAEGHYVLGNYDTVIEWCDRALREANAIWFPACLKIAAYAKSDRMKEAERAAAEMKERFPQATLSFITGNLTSNWLKSLDSNMPDILRDAGVPEE